MAGDRYPDDQMDFAQPLPAEWVRFAELREEALIDYGYNTARACWADLQDIFEWAAARDKDILSLTKREIRQYLGLLRRRKYSESTIRRRITALRLLYECAVNDGTISENAATEVVVKKIKTDARPPAATQDDQVSTPDHPRSWT